MSAAPPDPAVLQEGDTRLTRELAGLEERLAEALDALDQGLRDGITVPLAAALADARDRHRSLLEEAGLASGAGDEPPPSWRTLRRYREGVAREVVAPRLEALTSVAAGESVTSLWNAFLARKQEAAAPLPRQIRRTEPADLYTPADADGLWRRMLKGSVRTGRAVTGIFRRDRVREQVVPLGALARRSLRSEALPGVVDLAESLHLHYGRSVSALERAVGEWVRDWFPLEDAARSPLGHLEPSVAERLEDLRRSLGPLLEDLGLSRPTGAKEKPSQAPSAEDAERKADPEGEAGEAQPALPSLGGVARAFQEKLEGLADVPHPTETLAEVGRAVAAATARLAKDVHASGSSLARSLPRDEDQRMDRLRERLDRRAELWAAWHAAAAGRLRLTREILTLRGDLDRTLDGLLEEVLEASVLYLAEHLSRGRDGLLELHAEAVEPDSPLQGSAVREEVAEAVGDLLEAAQGVLEARVLEPLTAERMDPPVKGAADRAAEAIAERIRALPESVDVHPVRDPVLTLDPEQPTRAVRLQEFVRQSLDVMQLESLRTAPTSLLAAMAEARADCQEVPTVVEYNLTAARNELREAEGDDQAVLADARLLTLQGLERSARALDQVTAESLGPWDVFVERVHGVVTRAMTQSHQRLTMERAVQEQFRDIRSLVEFQLLRLGEWSGSAWSVTRRQLEHALRRAYLNGLRLLRRGRLALGAEQPQEGEAERAMEVLRGIPALLDPLPLVYRRLFSFQPVTDPSLLVGREDEKAWLGRRYAAWQDGARTPTVLTGPVTVGHTSFFNVVAATLFKDARVVRLTFPRRYRDEAGMVARLAEEFQRAGVIPESDDPWTLDRLANVLLDRAGDDPEEGPIVVLTEQLGHLFLRVPGGASMAERLLEFQARTSSGVFWVTSASDPLWKLLRKTEPRAAALVTTGSMSPMERDELEKLILVRHRRSGVPLEFLVPKDANPLLRRKLQRTRGEEERYELLKAEFFDRLHRASQGNVTMAILLWLKSADFASKEGWLQLRPPRPIRFTFLDELDTELDFALMAFLEHGSLTLEEYTAVFAARPDDAFQALEALRGRTLVDQLDTQGSLPQPVDRIEEGLRYRVPPILSQVVSTYLRNQNILH
ncbi:MAG TPA: hypothetical protein VLA43_14860 [Longimicrobiales bacterium]|nr:hypothetical protein [Longimicrobiales bacterium]